MAVAIAAVLVLAIAMILMAPAPLPGTALFLVGFISSSAGRADVAAGTALRKLAGLLWGLLLVGVTSAGIGKLSRVVETTVWVDGVPRYKRRLVTYCGHRYYPTLVHTEVCHYNRAGATGGIV